MLTTRARVADIIRYGLFHLSTPTLGFEAVVLVAERIILVLAVHHKFK
jgi:hypothetical protein